MEGQAKDQIKRNLKSFRSAKLKGGLEGEARVVNKKTTTRP